jgi:hypothetical protein
MGIAAAKPIAFIALDRGGGPSQSSDTPTPAVKTAAAADSRSDQSGSSSFALPLLIFIVIGLIVGYACFQLRRRLQQRQEQAHWRRQETQWEAAVGPVGTERGQTDRERPVTRPTVKSGSGPDASPPRSAVGLLTRAGTGPAGESRRGPDRSRS